jgi:hypothetical protein
MAINRLLLVCLRCNNAVSIARLQVGMDGIWLPSRETAEDRERWLATHSVCGEPQGETGLKVGLAQETEDGLEISGVFNSGTL